jgi:hypothetical protein
VDQQVEMGGAYHRNSQRKAPTASKCLIICLLAVFLNWWLGKVNLRQSSHKKTATIGCNWFVNEIQILDVFHRTSVKQSSPLNSMLIRCNQRPGTLPPRPPNTCNMLFKTCCKSLNLGLRTVSNKTSEKMRRNGCMKAGQLDI